MCAERGAGLFLLDEALELPPGELSLTLAQGVVRLGTKLPFEQAAAEGAFFWSVELDEATVRSYTQAAGAAYAPEQMAELERSSVNDRLHHLDQTSPRPRVVQPHIDVGPEQR